MITLIDFFNRPVTAFFSSLFTLSGLLGARGSLFLISILLGIGMLYLFGKVSNQAKIKTIKNTLQAHIIGILLFQQDIRVMFKLQWRVIKKTLVYMRYTLPAMVILFIPVLLILIQMNLYFSYRPLRVGEPAVVTATIKDDQWEKNKDLITLQSNGMTEVETSPIRIPSERQIAWRVRCIKPGTGDLTLINNGQAVTKQIIAGNRFAMISPLRTGSSSLDLFLNPGERKIPTSSPIESILISYPSRQILIWGWDIHWIIIFFVVSLIAGYAVKGFLKVEF